MVQKHRVLAMQHAASSNLALLFLRCHVQLL